jgi:putative flippase GtrA
MAGLKNHKEINRFLKYFLGGGIYFWLGYGIFAVFYSGLHLGWLPAKLIADLIGLSANYIVQRFWAFSDRANLREMKHAGRYITIEVVGFFLDYAIIWSLYRAGITPYIGFFISSGFFTVWSYLWYKYWVFPDRA